MIRTTTITIRQKPYSRTFCTQVTANADRSYLDWLGNKLGVKNLDDWYNVRRTKMVRASRKSAQLMKSYGSLHKMLSSVYKEHTWYLWKFSIAQKNDWSDINVQRQFMDDIAKKVGITKLDDWYNWNGHQLQPYGIRKMIQTCYGGNFFKALSTIYPEHPWQSWRFPKVVETEDWKNVDKLTEYIEWVGKDMGIKNLDDWYKVRIQDLRKRNGTTIVKVYKDSLYTILKLVYPQHPWKEWKFKRVTKFFWQDQANVKRFFDHAADVLGVQTMEDWYRISQEQLSMLGGGSLITRHRGIANLIMAAFPEYSWDRRRLGNTTNPKRAGQRYLLKQLQTLFPNQGVYEDYLHPQIQYPLSKDPLQLDVFIPHLNLAFEYQGQQHYKDIGHFQPQQTYQKRDNLKRILCEQNSISLIEVPYSWTKDKSSLVSSIIGVRPDLEGKLKNVEDR